MTQKELLKSALKRLTDASDAEDAADVQAETDRATSDVAQQAYIVARQAVEDKEGAVLRNALSQAGASEQAALMATVARTNAANDYNNITQNRAPAGG